MSFNPSLSLPLTRCRLERQHAPSKAERKIQKIEPEKKDEIMGSNSVWLRVFAVFIAQLVVGLLTVWAVQFTNIDWSAYMSQVQQSWPVGSELRYTALHGDTGPLVYPAGFVYLYSALHWLTAAGTLLLNAQLLFALLHSLSSALHALIALLCSPSLSLTALVPLVLSRRLASLHVLRLFNDCPAALLSAASLLAASLSFLPLATLLLALAVSVKMSALLYLPAFALLLWSRLGFPRAALHGAAFVALHVALGWPFLMHDARAYLSRAFELTRVFQHRWSVNYAFVPPDIFVMPAFSVALLVLHVTLLLLFAQTRWLRSVGGFAGLLKGRTADVTTRQVVRMMLESNFIGVICARTLHYQFYCWYFHTLVVLLLLLPLHLSRVSLVIRLAIVACVELVFNVYPPSQPLSIALHVCHFFALGLIYNDGRGDFSSGGKSKKK